MDLKLFGYIFTLSNNNKMTTITIQDLKENRESIISYINNNKMLYNVTLAIFMKDIVEHIEGYVFDEEESMMFNLEMIIDNIYRLNYSDNAIRTNRKKFSQLRETMGSLKEKEELKGNVWNPILKTWVKGK